MRAPRRKPGRKPWKRILGVVQAGREHVRDDAGHRSRPEHFVEPFQSAVEEQTVDVVEVVVNVLHRRLEI